MSRLVLPDEEAFLSLHLILSRRVLLLNNVFPEKPDGNAKSGYDFTRSCAILYFGFIGCIIK